MIRYLWSHLRAELRYRSERRRLKRDPYGYIRFVLGLPNATDEDLDAAADAAAQAARMALFTAAEVEAGLRQAFAPERVTKGSNDAPEQVG